MAARIARTAVLGMALLMCRTGFAADPAQEAAASFYRNYLALRQSGKMSGIPNEAQLARLAPFLSTELRGHLRKALREQQRCAKQFPGDKPPWIEGDIFSSHFEGFTWFEASAGRARRRGYEVKVKFRYAEGEPAVKWEDTLILRDDAGKLYVDDVLYRAAHAFSSGFGKNLKSSLKRIPAC